MSTRPRWFTQTGSDHSNKYLDRFRRLAASGVDLAGEARLLDAMVAPRSRLLDAGCGAGRVGGALFDRGHDVVGVDIDPVLIGAAETDHRGPRWIAADLSELDLAAFDEPEPFDAAILAGNVMVFVAPGTERDVIARVAAHVRADGCILVGFATDREYAMAQFDADIAELGIVLEHRFATWDLRPWSVSSHFAVTV
ncbi:MAG TPA: class I SAM-dependent methyltransferase, partial [Acidimicrobiales bacterium]|nr:class I SAM-dependent methyltransferase [Acidimicrobiales bacterium]